jgi:hypothetical protein
MYKLEEYSVYKHFLYNLHGVYSAYFEVLLLACLFTLLK